MLLAIHSGSHSASVYDSKEDQQRQQHSPSKSKKKQVKDEPRHSSKDASASGGGGGSSSTSKSERKQALDEFRKSLLIRFEYYDPGNHWCKHCNHVSSNVYEVFEHLHSKRHVMVSVPKLTVFMLFFFPNTWFSLW